MLTYNLNRFRDPIFSYAFNNQYLFGLLIIGKSKWQRAGKFARLFPICKGRADRKSDIPTIYLQVQIETGFCRLDRKPTVLLSLYNICSGVGIMGKQVAQVLHHLFIRFGF